MTLEQKMASIESALLILRKARQQSLNVYPVYSKLANASRHLENEVSAMMNDGKGEN